VNFTKPLMVSSGKQNDQLKVEIMDINNFVSAETGVVIDPITGFEGGINQISIPTQLPVGVSAADIQGNA
jgi:hypothetical protein